MKRTLALLALTAFGPSAAGATALRLDAGGAPAYVSTDAVVPLAGIALTVRAGVARESAAQNGVAALVAEVLLRTPVARPGGPPVALREAVAALGGSLSSDVEITTVRYYLDATPEALPAVAALVARVLAAPSFDAATLATARAAIGERIDEEQRNGVLVGLAALRNSYYRDAAALPALGTRASLAQLDAAAVRAFYGRWYVRGGAVVTAVGRTPAQTAGALRALVAALRAGTPPPPAPLTTKPFGPEPQRIVTRRDIGAAYAVAGFAAPALGDPDFAAALVVRALFEDVFAVQSATTPAPSRRAAGAIYSYDVTPAHFALWINGARLEPSTGLAALDRVLTSAAAQPLTGAVLQRYKQAARGAWQLEALTLDERATALAVAVELGLPADAADAVPGAIDAVSAADVQRVVKRWFGKHDVAIVLPRADAPG